MGDPANEPGAGGPPSADDGFFRVCLRNLAKAFANVTPYLIGAVVFPVLAWLLGAFDNKPALRFYTQTFNKESGPGEFRVAKACKGPHEVPVSGTCRMDYSGSIATLQNAGVLPQKNSGALAYECYWNGTDAKARATVFVYCADEKVFKGTDLRTAIRDWLAKQ